MRKDNNSGGNHRGDIEEYVGVFRYEKKQQKHYLRNNQIIQNTFAPEMASDLDSTMSGQGNTSVMVRIIGKMKQNMWVCLGKVGNTEQQHYLHNNQLNKVFVS